MHTYRTQSTRGKKVWDRDYIRGLTRTQKTEAWGRIDISSIAHERQNVDDGRRAGTYIHTRS